MSRTAVVITTLIAYKLLLLALGLWGQKKTHTAADFYLGGRALGPWVASLSAAASSSSAWTILGVSGAAYLWGLGAIWIFPGCVGGFLINWYGLAPGLRAMTDRTGAITVTELLAGPPNRPGSKSIRVVASLIILGSLGAYVCSQFQAAGKTFAKTFPDLLSANEAVLLGGLIIVAYTLLGGFWAVSLTDTLQGLLMAGTALVLPLGALAEVGGPQTLIAGLREASLLSVTRGVEWPAAVGFILGLLGIGLGYPGQVHVVNRLMALGGDDGALRRARFIAIAWAVLVYGGMLLLGWCGRVLWPGLSDSELVFVRATNELFPPVVSGLMLAGVLSAIMSTADSQLLVAGSTVTHDLRFGLSPESGQLGRSRLAVLLLSAGALVGALTTDDRIFGKVLFAWSSIGAAFGPVLLLSCWARRTPSPPWIVASMTVGAGSAVLAYYNFPEHEWKFMERVIPYLLASACAAIGFVRRP